MSIPIEVLNWVTFIRCQAGQLERLNQLMPMIVEGVEDAHGSEAADVIAGVYDSIDHINTDMQESLEKLAAACGFPVAQGKDGSESA